MSEKDEPKPEPEDEDEEAPEEAGEFPADVDYSSLIDDDTTDAEDIDADV